MSVCAASMTLLEADAIPGLAAAMRNSSSSIWCSALNAATACTPVNCGKGH